MNIDDNAGWRVSSCTAYLALIEVEGMWLLGSLLPPASLCPPTVKVLSSLAGQALSTQASIVLSAEAPKRRLTGQSPFCCKSPWPQPNSHDSQAPKTRSRGVEQ